MANTLKFGNGEWYGKKDTILAYNDENSNYKPLPFDFSRASKATVVNKEGLIETVANGIPRIDFLGNTKGALKLEPQRTNLITYSEDFTNPYWTKSGASIQGDPSTAGSELVTSWTNKDFASFSSSGSNITQMVSSGSGNNNYSAVTITSGKIYKLKFTSSQSIPCQIRISPNTNLTGASVVLNSLLSGTNEVYFTASSNYTYIGFYAPNSFTDTQISNFTLKEVQGFTSPDGTTNAYKLVEGTNNGGHTAYKLNTSISSGANYTYSVFVKGTERVLQMVLSSGFASNFCNFDLSDGTIGSKNGLVDSNITSFSNGWYRCDITALSNGASAHLEFILAESKTSSRYTTYQGNGTSGVYIYGAQLEQGSYATSYIPTQGSAVTRLKDACSQTPPTSVIGQTEGTVFAEIDYTPHSINYESVASLQGTSTQQYLECYFNSANKINIGIYNGGAVQVSFASASQTKGIKKIAIAYKSNDFAVYLNGTQIHTDNSGSVPLLSSLGLGINYSGSTFQLSQPIKQFQLYNTRLSNSELEALTQV